MDTSSIESWFSDNFVLLLVVAIGLVILYVLSDRFVHRAVHRALEATDRDMQDSGVADAELEKRSATIEHLATTLIRLGVVSLGIFIVIGILQAWTALLVIGLFLAGIVIAGQAIVLDYLMGVLIIFEGQFFLGDNVELGTLPWKGTVEDVGLRRTTIRGFDGTVYSISNGELRTVANRTRVYSAAEVKVRGIREADLRQVIAIMHRVGAEVATDPAFSERIAEAPGFRYLEDPDDLGITATMRGKIVAAERWAVTTEVRLRLIDALVAEGIELNKRVFSAKPR